MDQLKQAARRAYATAVEEADRLSIKSGEKRIQFIADTVMLAVLEQQAKERDNPSIEIGTIMSHQTKEGRVEMSVGGVAVQLSLSKAREVETFLRGAIEAATTDQIVWAALTDLGVPERAAGAFLLEMREKRQGSKGTVYAS